MKKIAKQALKEAAELAALLAAWAVLEILEASAGAEIFTFKDDHILERVRQFTYESITISSVQYIESHEMGTMFFDFSKKGRLIRDKLGDVCKKLKKTDMLHLSRYVYIDMKYAKGILPIRAGELFHRFEMQNGAKLKCSILGFKKIEKTYNLFKTRNFKKL